MKERSFNQMNELYCNAEDMWTIDLLRFHFYSNLLYSSKAELQIFQYALRNMGSILDAYLCINTSISLTLF